MSDNVYLGSVTGNDGRCGESETRVFHSAVREGLGEEEDVVNAKLVLGREVLGGSDKVGSVLVEFPIGSVHVSGFGPAAGIPVPARELVEWFVGEFACTDGDEVARDANGLNRNAFASAYFDPFFLKKARDGQTNLIIDKFRNTIPKVNSIFPQRTHQHFQTPTRTDLGIISRLDRRRILARKHAPRMNSLALGVEVGVFTRFGLLRSEPPNGGTLGSGRVGDFNGNGLKSFVLIMSAMKTRVFQKKR